MRYVVSACLLGENCKYSGGNNRDEKLIEALQGHEVFKVCPEILGGLPVPRIPVELVEGIAINREGVNVHREFCKGAQEALRIVKENRVDAVIVQPRSPSCGKDTIYSGFFNGELIAGNGVFVQLLLENQIPVLTPEEFLRKRNVVEEKRM